jgi:hypothetical protein
MPFDLMWIWWDGDTWGPIEMDGYPV